MSRTKVSREDDQNGPVYIYEHEQLLLAGRRSRSLGDSPVPASQFLDPSTLDLPRYHQMVSSGGHYNPVALRAICIEYVARNITIVESLIGFPDLVGLEIFKCVCRQGHLKDIEASRTQSILRLFVQSYRDEILSELDLSVFPRYFLDKNLAMFTTFMFIRKLDVSDQQLGEDHQLWRSVAEMPSLTHLALKNNILSNLTLQNMTLPGRMFQTGPIHLQVLNLACNPAITDAGLRYLICFRKLCDLDLSGTGVTADGLKKVEQTFSLRQVEVKDGGRACMFSLRAHSGWAVTVIELWLQAYRKSVESTDNTPSSNGQRLSTSSFYNRRRSHQQYVSPSPKTPCPSPEPQLRLVSTLSAGSAYTDSNSPTLSMNAEMYEEGPSGLNLTNPQYKKTKLEASQSLSDGLLSQYAETSQPRQTRDQNSASIDVNYSTNDIKKAVKITMQAPKTYKNLAVNRLCGAGEYLEDKSLDMATNVGMKATGEPTKSLWSAMNSDQW